MDNDVSYSVIILLSETPPTECELYLNEIEWRMSLLI